MIDVNEKGNGNRNQSIENTNSSIDNMKSVDSVNEDMFETKQKLDESI